MDYTNTTPVPSFIKNDVLLNIKKITTTNLKKTTTVPVFVTSLHNKIKNNNSKIVIYYDEKSTNGIIIQFKNITYEISSVVFFNDTFICRYENNEIYKIIMPNNQCYYMYCNSKNNEYCYNDAIMLDEILSIYFSKSTKMVFNLYIKNKCNNFFPFYCYFLLMLDSIEYHKHNDHKGENYLTIDKIFKNEYVKERLGENIGHKFLIKLHENNFVEFQKKIENVDVFQGQLEFADHYLEKTKNFLISNDIEFSTIETINLETIMIETSNYKIKIILDPEILEKKYNFCPKMQIVDKNTKYKQQLYFMNEFNEIFEQLLKYIKK